VGFRSYRATNLHYGRFAGEVEQALGQRLPSAYYGIGAVLTEDGKSPEGHIVLRMRPELVKALESLGWVAGTPDSGMPTPGIEAIPADISITQAKALHEARIGQGKFRTQVASYWGGCAVTGCRALQLLAASHIKPWRDSNDRERLDPYNGLLLTPNLHALFDLGLISFNDDGGILLSRRADPGVLDTLGVHSGCRIKRLTAKHREYLRVHRQSVFKR
jgi:hypothetical protein